MNTKKLSLIASLLLVSTSSVLAESNSIKEAFANSKVSGDITVYTKSENKKTSTDSGWTSLNGGINFETDSFKGLSFKAGLRANHELAEEEDGNYESKFENDAVLTEANITYANSDFSVTAGRQEIDLEWLGDYNEGVTAEIKAIENTSIVLGYTNRQAAISDDESGTFASFTDYNGKKTEAFVADVKFEGIQDVVLNPYYYNADGIASFYGLKADYNTDIIGLTAHYATTSEENPASKDGNILHLEASTSLAGVSLAAGYITTDKDGGTGSLTTLGENISPTKEIDDQVYGTDAQTFYAKVGYKVAGVSLKALYADTEYDTVKKDVDETTFWASYDITEELEVSLRHSIVDSSVLSDEKTETTAALVYSF